VSGQKVNNYTWASGAGWAEGYFLSSIKRVGQALETRVLLDQLFVQNSVANIIVCGDFNAEPGEVPVEAICGRIENTGNPELRPSVMIPCSLAIAKSLRFSHIHHGKGNLLDHMLISQTLYARFNKASILNENLHDESLPFASDLKFPESDHAAFVAEFNL
jgi:predicted extracellular nuclease